MSITAGQGLVRCRYELWYDGISDMIGPILVEMIFEHFVYRDFVFYGKKLDTMLRNHDDIPEWCQKKIILASDYLGSVYHYMDYKLSQH